MEKPRLRWNWKNANWASFREAVDEQIAGNRDRLQDCSVSERVTFLTESILGAARAHIGMVRAKRPGGGVVTAEIKEAIRLRNSVGRDRANRREEWIQACGRVRQLIFETMQRMWREFVESLEDHAGSPQTWMVIHSLSGKAPSAAGRNKVLIHRGREFHTDRRKADAFVQSYAGVSSHNFSLAERKKNREVKKALSRAEHSLGPQEMSGTCFNISELKSAIGKAKRKAAEGADGISPQFLKELGE